MNDRVDIEHLVQYFEDQGFTVRVIPFRLLISKTVNGEICGYAWGIARTELQYIYPDVLWAMARDIVTQLEQAIAERKLESNPGGMIER